MKIKKSDLVLVISGNDRLKKGKVVKVLPSENKVLIEGVNIAKKHVKPKRSGEKGQILQIAKPISVSKVKLICPKCNAVSRVGYDVIAEKKARVCKKCGQEI
ncbi:MAG: 50S ribosomal protein L24 [Candidatus Paceibacterota bacterium]|jgi:large subunit ribosomal protein L24|nr:50S ribosomal protein L24 [Candidatus Paceibacterota bacterium]MDD4830780.1 50S ribosomal protein L24 [Candidatus Paceibacterota bacterium]MDD4875298.1 50S ribosomal protein L24 [Candidatus Paceibacterota bacterium]